MYIFRKPFYTNYLFNCRWHEIDHDDKPVEHAISTDPLEHRVGITAQSSLMFFCQNQSSVDLVHQNKTHGTQGFARGPVTLKGTLCVRIRREWHVTKWRYLMTWYENSTLQKYKKPADGGGKRAKKESEVKKRANGRASITVCSRKFEIKRQNMLFGMQPPNLSLCSFGGSVDVTDLPPHIGLWVRTCILPCILWNGTFGFNGRITRLVLTARKVSRFLVHFLDMWHTEYAQSCFSRWSHLWVP